MRVSSRPTRTPAKVATFSFGFISFSRSPACTSFANAGVRDKPRDRMPSRVKATRAVARAVAAAHAIARGHDEAVGVVRDC